MGVVRLGKKTKQCHGSMLVGRGCCSLVPRPLPTRREGPGDEARVAGSRMDIKQKIKREEK